MVARRKEGKEEVRVGKGRAATRRVGQDGREEARCSLCKAWLTEEEFSPGRWQNGGYCRSCVRSVSRSHRKIDTPQKPGAAGGRPRRQMTNDWRDQLAEARKRSAKAGKKIGVSEDQVTVLYTPVTAATPRANVLKCAFCGTEIYATQREAWTPTLRGWCCEDCIYSGRVTIVDGTVTQVKVVGQGR